MVKIKKHIITLYTNMRLGFTYLCIGDWKKERESYCYIYIFHESEITSGTLALKISAFFSRTFYGVLSWREIHQTQNLNSKVCIIHSLALSKGVVQIFQTNFNKIFLRMLRIFNEGKEKMFSHSSADFYVLIMKQKWF